MSNGPFSSLRGLLQNPIQSFRQASQPGGLLAPVTSMNQFLGDPRVNVGLAIASGNPIGDALLQSAQIQEALAPEVVDAPTTKAATIMSGPEQGRQVFVTNAEIAANPELYGPPITGQTTKILPDGTVEIGPAADFKSQEERQSEANNIYTAAQNLANLGNDALQFLEKAPIGATGGVVRAFEGLADQTRQAAEQFGFNINDFDRGKLKSIVENQYGSEAANNARFFGTITTLAYGLARIEEPNNPRLSDGDIERQLARLGSSQSKEVFAAGIDTAIDQSIRNAKTQYSVLTQNEMPDVNYMGYTASPAEKPTINNDPLGLFD
jgi:hypothetical protein